MDVFKFSSVGTSFVFRREYSQAFKRLIERGLKQGDGFEVTELSRCEKRLNLKLPRAFREYYELAGRLPINTEHNILYDPKKLKIWKGKLLFMEENQRVVFWGLDMQELDQTNPQVFQARNSEPIEWYSEEKSFSEFILSMWRWLRRLDTPKRGAQSRGQLEAGPRLSYEDA